MATPQRIVYSVLKLYGAKGRQVDDHIQEAYITALQHDRTDYQVEMATEAELRSSKDNDHPITAQGLRVLAGNYPKTEAEAEQQRRDATKRLPPPEPRDFVAERRGMLGMTHELLAEETDPKQRAWYQDLIVRLEKQQHDADPRAGLVRR